MDRRKKQKEVFFTGFCVTFLLAAAFVAFLCVDYSLFSAGFDGGIFARQIVGLWDQIQQWAEIVGETAKNGIDRIVNFLKYFFQQMGNLLHCVGSVI